MLVYSNCLYFLNELKIHESGTLSTNLKFEVPVSYSKSELEQDTITHSSKKLEQTPTPNQNSENTHDSNTPSELPRERHTRKIEQTSTPNQNSENTQDSSTPSKLARERHTRKILSPFDQF